MTTLTFTPEEMEAIDEAIRVHANNIEWAIARNPKARINKMSPQMLAIREKTLAGLVSAMAKIEPEGE